MSESKVQSPGTVSRILWHFTGGPLWDASERRQNMTRKSPALAYGNLRSILKSRELRLGSYKEVVRVRVPPRKYNKQKGKFETQPSEVKELISSPVCCLADVPIIHLSYLAPRYGKFAIGFHRESVVKHGFNPVFYALEDAKALSSIYRGLSHLEGINSDFVRAVAVHVQQTIGDFLSANKLETTPELDSFFDIISVAADEVDNAASKARGGFENFLGLVKTFVPSEFGTIYCEREWRSLVPFKFVQEAVAMVVIPRTVGANQYFKKFVADASRLRLLPREVPIVPWEDLVEH